MPGPIMLLRNALRFSISCLHYILYPFVSKYGPNVLLENLILTVLLGNLIDHCTMTVVLEYIDLLLLLPLQGAVNTSCYALPT